MKAVVTTPRMHKEIKRRWLVALRSGTFKQCRTGRLKDKWEHCVLGVLCEVFTQYKTYNHERCHWGGNSVMVNDRILEDVRLPYSVAKRLSRWNDYGATFEQLANWIEKNI